MEPAALHRELEDAAPAGTAVIATRGAAKRYGIEDILRQKAREGLVWIDDVAPNTTHYTVWEALRAPGDARLSHVIAIGGGSVIDLAKAVVALWGGRPFADARQVMEAVRTKAYLKEEGGAGIAITAVPTTAGTGSEVTAWATVWDADERKKYSVDAPWLVPQRVWMVPELTLSLPPRQTLSTGLDAVCQAAEAYWAKRSDPLVKAVAVRAVEMASRALPQILAQGNDLQARRDMCTASLLSGIAFSKTRTTACHSISYPLTAEFGVEHGFAAALTLAPVAAINSRAVDCTELYAAFQGFGEIGAWVDSVSRNVQCMRLSAFGVAEKDIPLIAEKAFTAGRMDNNPVDLDQDDVVDILKAVL